mmetsp:Transcript_16559/g.22362  ORF Transcript_16559/g.22362 Transcript_16559/m.22362 type:complete len:95 (-) Transcript_16559:2156-2440(-)
MRILGSTSNSVTAEKVDDDPLKAMQQACGPETDREKNQAELDQQHSSTVKVRASQDKMIRQPYQLIKDDDEDKPKRVQDANPLAMTNFKLNEPS